MQALFKALADAALCTQAQTAPEMLRAFTPDSAASELDTEQLHKPADADMPAVSPAPELQDDPSASSQTGNADAPVQCGATSSLPAVAACLPPAHHTLATTSQHPIEATAAQGGADSTLPGLSAASQPADCPAAVSSQGQSTSVANSVMAGLFMYSTAQQLVQSLETPPGQEASAAAQETAGQNEMAMTSVVIGAPTVAALTSNTAAAVLEVPNWSRSNSCSHGHRV